MTFAKSVDPLHTLVSLETVWRDNVADREEIEEELLHAQSMRNKKRMKQCEQWLAEAQDMQEKAFQRMTNARTGAGQEEMYGVAKFTDSLRGKATKRAAL